jgi:hypothetical protein
MPASVFVHGRQTTGHIQPESKDQNPTLGEKDNDDTDGNNQGTREKAHRDEDTPGRVAAGMGSCPSAAPRKGESLHSLS